MSDLVESLERATLAAVPPEILEDTAHWLLPLDSGTVGRAHSAVPLRHAQPDSGVLDFIEARYQAHGLRTVLRLPRLVTFDPLKSQLLDRGFHARKPTLTQTSEVAAVLQVGGTAQVDMAFRPDADWTALFLGEGLDPMDVASRLQTLGRSTVMLFASVRIEGRMAAVGAVGLSHGWAGVHGMRTAHGFRRMGLAGSILRAFAGLASERNIERMFLQVEEANTGAQSVYRRAGFQTAWAYEYWQRQ